MYATPILSYYPIFCFYFMFWICFSFCFMFALSLILTILQACGISPSYFTLSTPIVATNLTTYHGWNNRGMIPSYSKSFLLLFFVIFNRTPNPHPPTNQFHSFIRTYYHFLAVYLLSLCYIIVILLHSYIVTVYF